MGEIDWEGLKAQLAELDNLELRDQDLPDDEEEDDDEEGLYDYDSYESDDNDDGLSDYYGYEGADSEEDKKALIEATKESLVQLGGQDTADKYGKYLTEEDAIKNASVLYPEKRTYRSLLLDVFTPDQMIEIHKITKTFSISAPLSLPTLPSSASSSSARGRSTSSASSSRPSCPSRTPPSTIPHPSVLWSASSDK